MQKPEITLKSIRVHTGLLDETPAYTAKVYWDGEHFADVSNDGHGGCDIVHAPRGKEEGFNGRLEILEFAIGETYPVHKCDFGDGSLKENLEMLCHGLVWEHVDQRNMKSRLSRTVMALVDGKVYTYKGKKTEGLMDGILVNNPKAVILNRLPFAEAWKIVNETA